MFPIATGMPARPGRRTRRLLLRSSGGRGGPAGGLLEAVRPAELLAESLHPAGGVDELLLAREERVAVAANVDRQLGLGAARRKGVATRAVNAARLITRMNLGFHG